MLRFEHESPSTAGWSNLTSRREGERHGSFLSKLNLKQEGTQGLKPQRPWYQKSHDLTFT
jgi:hypothetical protein